MDWPIAVPFDDPVFISNVDLYTQKTGLRPTFTDTTWGAISYVTASPLYVPAPMTVKKLYVLNGTVVSGNCDIGLVPSRWVTYRGGKTIIQAGGTSVFGGSWLAHAGTTAQSGASQWQVFNTTDVKIAAGLYYLLYALDNTTGRVLSITNTSGGLDMIYAAGTYSYPAGALPLSLQLPFSSIASVGSAASPPIVAIGGAA